jgi:hypothetical protein
MADTTPAERLRGLFELFADKLPVELPGFEVVAGDELPAPHRELLVHDQHMTVTLERFYGRPVALRVLAQHWEGNEYARMILLALEGSDEIVEFGIFRMDLNCCSEEVRTEIVAGKTPLGRILIQHDVLRRIDPAAFLKIAPHKSLMLWFGLEQPEATYGRIANIFCNGMLAIELLEIVRPVPGLV